MASPAVPAWPDTNRDLAVQYKVHLGLWTDWSRGRVLGATLTLDRQEANLLIAFTASFVVFIGSRFWRIICLFLHQLYSTSSPRDALHHQRQVLLRNSGASDSGVFKFVALLHAWRRLNLKSIVRIVPALLSAILCTVGFTIAGGFSSQIQMGRNYFGNAVLVDGANCSMISNVTSAIGLLSYHKLAAGLIDTANNYVRQCYSVNSTGLADCNYFVSRRLPGFVDSQAPCPFEDSICRSNSTNLVLDTGYINTDAHLGLNAPPQERLLMRHTLQCAPLVTKGHSSAHGNYTRYNYGAQWRRSDSDVATGDFTYEVENLENQYRISGDGKMIAQSYKLWSLFSGTVYRTPGDHPSSGFVPMDALARTDADLYLVFLSGNGVVFSEPLDDDWYRATKLFGTMRPMHQDTIPIYRTSEDASPLACASQWQFCNTDTSACGPTASFVDAMLEAAEAFGVDWDSSPETWSPAADRLNWLVQSTGIQGSGLTSMLMMLHDSALLSKQSLIEGYQGPIPENQWQLDVTNWFSIYLSYVQLYLLQSASGFQEAPSGIEVTKPTTEATSSLCSNQKIRTTRYSSFSFFGILFTYILGALVVITSYSLEPILACLHRRRQYRQYAYLEWTTNETLQLHRIANEGPDKSDATWVRCTDMVPTTAPGIILSSLDISDLKHPRLPSTGQGEITASSDATDCGANTPEALDPANSSPGLEYNSAQESQVTDDMTNTVAETQQVCVQNMETMDLSPIQEQQSAQVPTLSSHEIEAPSPLEDTPIQDTFQISHLVNHEQVAGPQHGRVAVPPSSSATRKESEGGSVCGGGAANGGSS